MTDTIEELERLLAAATEGPWSKEVNFYSTGATVIFGPKPEQVLISEDTQFATDAALIVALRNAAPSLLASLKAVTAERDAMAEALKRADMKAEGGLCAMTFGGARVFLREVRDIAAEAALEASNA